MPVLAALGTVVGGFVIGGILIGFDHVLIGIVVGLCSLPAALAVWIKLNDRI